MPSKCGTRKIMIRKGSRPQSRVWKILVITPAKQIVEIIILIIENRGLKYT